MSTEKILTKQIAEKFLKENAGKIFKSDYSVDLSEFTSIEDAAAQALAQHKGGLYLGLTSLSDAAAQALAQSKGDLHLGGLTSLSDAAAQALAQHKGWVGLSGLTSLSDGAAASLAKYKGDLHFNHLTSLSDGAAEALAKHDSEKRLAFESLTSLSDVAITALAKRKGFLRLFALRSLSDAAAEALSKHEGELHLYGLESLSAAAAMALSKHEGKLELSGKAKKALTAAIAKASKLKTGTVSWNGDFLKSAKERFKEEFLLKDGYSSVEILLNSAVSYGTSKANILKWLEENDICSGGDTACQMAVELAWLVGAWDVSYEELIEDSESQSADEMTERAAEAIAKAVVSGKKK